MSDDCDSESVRSVDSIDVNVIESRVEADLQTGALVYVCRQVDGSHVEVDRSDLMDGAKHQRLVLDFEKRHPPPWDEVCTHCEGAGCDECVCDECGRPCRHIMGVNYGCVRHPVI